MRVKDIAKQEGINEYTVRRWINTNLLKASTDSLGYIIDPQDFKNFKQNYLKPTINPKKTVGK